MRHQIYVLRTLTIGGQEDISLFLDEKAADEATDAFIRSELSACIDEDELNMMTHDELVDQASEDDCSFDLDWQYLEIPNS